ncbi:DUF1707 domain-containing protein [Nonomuraea sp. NPDC005501]|uniref:DUF1707 SHOCT-like domain-containing protein n=1 Tax=Nonomuraea sp. NPDC005501 TaxID=3156884 RepID=UPI0033A36017
MDERREVRASDGDREAAAERLRVAVEEGCLDFGEFDERVGLAYQSVTRRDLAELVADLPDPGLPAPDPASPPPRRASLPGWLKVAWAVWGVALVVSVASWVVEALSDPCPVEFSPGGLAGPGVVLLVLTVVLRRRSAPPSAG